VKIAWSVRLARDADVPGLEKVIPLSVRALQARYYSTAQMDGALGSVFGFRSAKLVATLPGEPFYAAFNYSAIERYDVPLANGLGLPVVRMIKNFGPS
jgi:hypothetical protein